MYTNDKSVFILPSGVRIVGFDSLEIMARICNISVMDFAQGYGTAVEKLMTTRLSSRKDPLTGRLEE